MADIIDNGNDTAELFLNAAMANRRVFSLPPKGKCHYCDEPIEDGSKFCDRDCRDDWEAEQKLKMILGRG